MNTKQKITHRINAIPQEILQKQIQTLQTFGIHFFNNQGNFHYNTFKKDCRQTLDLLAETEVPNPKTKIRYQFCFLMACIQTIVGTRNMGFFLSEN